jgi:ADP-heptose:LPS heptosyltransferase
MITRAVGGLLDASAARFAWLLGEPGFSLLGFRRRGEGESLTRARRLLVVRLDETGNVVLASPLLRELRRNLPTAWITLVVKPAVRNLVELCPHVDEVLTFDWSGGRHSRFIRRQWRTLRLAGGGLWPKHFDWALIPRRDVDHYHARLLAYFSGAAYRVGYSQDKALDSTPRIVRRTGTVLTHELWSPWAQHEVEHNLDVIRLLGGRVESLDLEAWLGEEDEAFAERYLASHQIRPDDQLIAVCPGAGSAKRMWPVGRFAELTAWLRVNCGSRVVVVGAPGEEPLGEHLRDSLGSGVINAAGRTTLRQAAALVKRSVLFVGNDTGPMHLAAAVGVPVVEISCHPANGSPAHPNSPRRFHPWQVPHAVIQPVAGRDDCVNGCRSEFAHCILGVSVEQVKGAVLALQARRTGTPQPGASRRGRTAATAQEAAGRAGARHATDHGSK